MTAMKLKEKTENLLRDVQLGKAITKKEAVELLSLNENSLEAALLRSIANIISRKKFKNNALLLGQIGIDMAPCDGDCGFCFFAKSHTQIQPSILTREEIVQRCLKYAEGGAAGAFLITMHRFGFDWFLKVCAEVKAAVPSGFEILSNVGDLDRQQLKELIAAGVSGAYHVCRLREGRDSCMLPSARKATIEDIIDSGLDWYNMCEPVGPEHTPEELAEQIWLGVHMPCRQHGAMQRFPVPGSPLYHKGQISVSRLAQVVAVTALATSANEATKSIAVNVSNIAGLLSGANALFPEAGEPAQSVVQKAYFDEKTGFSTALWRQSDEITTADCRWMLSVSGFSNLLDAVGKPLRKLYVFPAG